MDREHDELERSGQYDKGRQKRINRGYVSDEPNRKRRLRELFRQICEIGEELRVTTGAEWVYGCLHEVKGDFQVITACSPEMQLAVGSDWLDLTQTLPGFVISQRLEQTRNRAAAAAAAAGIEQPVTEAALPGKLLVLLMGRNFTSFRSF